jgi:hypothetical protein
MSRGLHSDIKDELAKDNIVFADIVELFLPGGTQRLTNAGFDIVTTTTTGGSGTFSANGEFLSFDLVSETLEARVNQINVVLSAASNTFTNLFMNNDYLNSRVCVHRVFFDSSFQQVNNPLLLWDGEIVGYRITENTKSSTISIVSSSVFYDFERVVGRRTNDKSQQTIFPGDRGMEFSTMAIGNIKWGRDL